MCYNSNAPVGAGFVSFQLLHLVTLGREGEEDLSQFFHLLTGFHQKFTLCPEQQMIVRVCRTANKGTSTCTVSSFIEQVSREMAPNRG